MSNTASSNGSSREGQRLVVATEHHFVDVSGKVYTSLAFGYDYWREFLEVFDEVLVLARVGRKDNIPDDHFRADGPGVSFLAVPDYLGPLQFVRRLPGVMIAAWKAARFDSCFLLRSGNVCTALWIWLMLLRKPYAREVPGSIWESIFPVTRTSHPLSGRILAELCDLLARIQLRFASCAWYISDHCRRLYPTGRPDREIMFSDVRLGPDLVRSPRPASSFNHLPLRILSVGRVEREKGHHVLVEAARILRQRGGVGWKMTIVGPGRQLEPLREKVRQQNLSESVEFVGPVPYGRQLFQYLDEADLFVLPSLTEGLPRSLIEAMGRGLPALGSRAGGITELLTDDQLVPPDRPDLLALALEARIGKADVLARDSAVNFKKAITEFNAEEMMARKLRFWNTIRANSQIRRAA